MQTLFDFAPTFAHSRVNDHAPALSTPAPAAWPSNQIKPLWIGERRPGPRTESPDHTRDYWFANIATHPLFDPDKEHLAVLLLNTKYHCIAWSLISIGTLNSAEAHPREIIRPAVAAAAYAMILMHNHPSGVSDPSDADRTLTIRINDACRLMQIQFLDHVILGRGVADRHFSFRAAGVI